MDGYIQSTMAANTAPLVAGRNTNVQTIRTVPPFPPTNKDFSCTVLHTPDGIYPLLHEIFYDTIAPYYTSGTRASFATTKHHFQVSIHAESSEDEHSGSSLTSPTLKPVAMPIPTTSTKRTSRTASASSITVPKTQIASGSYMMSSSHEIQTEPVYPENQSNTTGSISSLSSLFSRNTTATNPSSTKSSSIARSVGSSSKPKNHLSRTASSFVLKFLIHENLQKLVSPKEDEFAFFNIGSSFIWADSNSTVKEPLSRIVFAKSYPTCHDINETTRCEDHIDVIIGFSTGDVMWYEPLSCKYVRLNKGGSMINSPVTMIQWIPGSEDLFMVLFKNGSVLIMDKERDDQAFNIPEPISWVESEFQVIKPHKSSKYNPISFWRVGEKELTDFCFSPDNMHTAITSVDGKLRIIDFKSERLTDVFSSYFGKFTCVDWSPDGRYILTGGEDDFVSIWSFVEKRLIARCQGHKSFVTGVAFDRWKCEEDTIRFGSVGEDCNLILWDFSFSALQKPKNSSRTTSTLPPKPTSPTTITTPLPSPSVLPPVVIERKKSLKNHRLFRGFSSPDTSLHSPPTAGSFIRFRKRSSKSSHLFSSGQQDYADVILEDCVVKQQPLPILHPALKKSQAAILQPITRKTVHADPCLSIQFREDTIVTTDRRGRIRSWGRP